MGSTPKYPSIGKPFAMYKKRCTVHYILSAVLKLIIVLGLVLKLALKTWELDTRESDMKV